MNAINSSSERCRPPEPDPSGNHEVLECGGEKCFLGRSRELDLVRILVREEILPRRSRLDFWKDPLSQSKVWEDMISIERFEPQVCSRAWSERRIGMKKQAEAVPWIITETSLARPK
jgi:hypothetical protein